MRGLWDDFGYWGCFMKLVFDKEFTRDVDEDLKNLRSRAPFMVKNAAGDDEFCTIRAKIM